MKKSIKENRPRGLAICCLPGRSFLEQSTSMATLLPIDKVIGRLYPLFGAVLLTMAFGIGGAIFFGGYTLPEMSLTNLHPEGLPIWPYMFVTVACGAISGFHATQSPIVAKCITSEKEGRRVFYGAMLKESMIALVWAAGGVAFYGTTGSLHSALSSLGQCMISPQGCSVPQEAYWRLWA